jgi:hypothetical protein
MEEHSIAPERQALRERRPSRCILDAEARMSHCPTEKAHGALTCSCHTRRSVCETASRRSSCAPGPHARDAWAFVLHNHSGKDDTAHVPHSNLQKSSPQRDRDSVRSIICLQLVHTVLDVKVYGCL